MAIQKTRWVDDQGVPVAEVDEVGRVTEPFVDEGDDIDHGLRTVALRVASAASDAGSSRRRSWSLRIFARSVRRQNVAGCSAYDTVTSHPPGASRTSHDQSAYDGLPSS